MGFQCAFHLMTYLFIEQAGLGASTTKKTRRIPSREETQAGPPSAKS